MSKPIPPLNALRAFEAAARLGSFTRATEELGVTPAAIGQQVRSLEAFLGQTLFHRSANGLEPTARASEALPVLRSGFDQIAEAVRMLSSASEGRSLRVSVSPSVALMWLVPRLPRFYDEHPGIEIVVDAMFHHVDISRGEADIAIRFGPGRYQGLASERLINETVLPLCSPELRDRCNLHSIADLANAPLIHVMEQTSDPDWPTWRGWAERHGIAGDGFERGPRFTRSGIALAQQAAVAGQGVTLSSAVCAIDHVGAGRLIAPLGAHGVVRVSYGYDLVFSAALAQSRPIAAFRAWAKAEARATERMIASLTQPDAEA